MKKISKKDLQGLRRLFPILGKEEMRRYVGGYSNGYWGGGSSGTDYYFDGQCYGSGGITQDEFNNWEGTWYGGWVYGLGYVGPDVNIYGSGDSSHPLPEVTIYGSYLYSYQSGGNGWPGWSIGSGDSNSNGYPGFNGYPRFNGYPGYGYYEFKGYYGNSDSGGSGGNHDNGSLTDGINPYNERNFSFLMDTNSVFYEQLMKILKSNSILKALFSYFDKGVVHMTFDIQDDVSIAQTTYPSFESYHITFSSQHIDENGWTKILHGDNVGYDWTKVRTNEEALVVLLAHEAQHANHVARFYDAVKQARNDVGTAVDILQNRGYNQEYINIFFQNESGKWGYVPGQEQVNRMHDYMAKYNHGVLDSALREYRNDYKC